MKCISCFLLSAALALGCALPTGTAGAQEMSPVCASLGPGQPLPPAVVQACETLKVQLVGAWTLVAINRESQDGRKLPLLGGNPRGSLVLDPSGHFSLIAARSDLAAFDRTKTTGDQAKAILEGMNVAYGTFTLTNNGYSKLIRMTAQFAAGGQSDPETQGQISSATGDEFAYGISEPRGEVIRLVWKRQK